MNLAYPNNTIKYTPQKEKSRRIRDRFVLALLYLSILLTIGSLITLLVTILVRGLPYLNFDFFTSFASSNPLQSGIIAPLIGTVLTMLVTIILTVPLGIATALYLQEFAPKNRLIGLIELNIANLAGVPSIIYGLLGLGIFVQFLFSGQGGILAIGMTLSLLVLPIVIVSSQEAIKNVPNSYRFAALALGATRWQMAYRVVLKQALPGILSGVILGISRAIGETAPVLLVSGVVYVNFLPISINDTVTVLPLQIYQWLESPDPIFQFISATAMIVLLAAMLIMNLVAVIIRSRIQKVELD